MIIIELKKRNESTSSETLTDQPYKSKSLMLSSLRLDELTWVPLQAPNTHSF